MVIEAARNASWSSAGYGMVVQIACLLRLFSRLAATPTQSCSWCDTALQSLAGPAATHQRTPFVRTSPALTSPRSAPEFQHAV